MADKLTWEQSVLWLQQQPDQQDVVRSCYYDDPLLDAARRFASSAEWQAVRRLLPVRPGRALDIGAGRGISSFALASDGWQVTALEPDPSPVVGAAAIRSLAGQAGLPIQVVEEFGEQLPFEDASFDLVYGREVLHHARDLQRLCREAARVLRPGGILLATREHVISRRSDLPLFLERHPLHRFYGGENAFLLEEYRAAITAAGLEIRQILEPMASRINTYPIEGYGWQYWQLQFAMLRYRLARRLPPALGLRLSRSLDAPGRMYSFLAVKPNGGA